jgi:hypothetical protein
MTDAEFAELWDAAGAVMARLKAAGFVSLPRSARLPWDWFRAWKHPTLCGGRPTTGKSALNAIAFEEAKQAGTARSKFGNFALGGRGTR